MMDLHVALTILAESHTREDDLTGFVVLPGPRAYGWWTEADYIKAWETVRKHIGLKVEPAHASR